MLTSRCAERYHQAMALPVSRPDEARSRQVPFTVCADLELEAAGSHWLRDYGNDVTIRRGRVPESLPSPAWTIPRCQYVDGRLLFTAVNGIRFLLEDGRSVRYDWPPGSDAVAMRRMAENTVLGPVWAMLAMQRGLLPLHAGANKARAGNHVHAFTGRSGAGKSTLAAGLAVHGFHFFSDDVLLLDPASFGEICLCWGLPRLRLWPDALAMLGGVESGPRVRSGQPGGKMNAEPHQMSPVPSGRLRTLYVLADGDSEVGENRFHVEPLHGVHAAHAWMNAVMRRGVARRMLGQQQLLDWAVSAVKHVEVFVLRRWMARERYDGDTRLLVQVLEGAA